MVILMVGGLLVILMVTASDRSSDAALVIRYAAVMRSNRTQRSFRRASTNASRSAADMLAQTESIGGGA